MKKDELVKAILNVYEELSELSDKEFQLQLEKHKEGDLANIVLYTDTFNVGEIESNFFSDYSDYYSQGDEKDFPIDISYEYTNEYEAIAHLNDAAIILSNDSASTFPVCSDWALPELWLNKLDQFSIGIPSQMGLFASTLIDMDSDIMTQPYSDTEPLFSYSIDIPSSQLDENKIYSLEDESERKLAA